MMYAGIDPSLNGTGIVFVNDKGSIEHFLSFTTRIKKLDSFEISIPRKLDEDKNKETSKKIIFIVDVIIDALKQKDLKLIGLEGYSYGSSSRGMTSLAEFSGYLKIRMIQENFPFVIFPPTNVKKTITDKGNASKDLMKEWCQKINNSLEWEKEQYFYNGTDLYDAYSIGLLTWLYDIYGKKALNNQKLLFENLKNENL